MTRGLIGVLILSVFLSLSGCSRQTPRQKADKHLKMGKAAFAERQYSRAALQFKLAASQAPEDPEPLYQLALTHIALRNGDAAVVALQAALSIKPTHAGALVKLGDMMVASGAKELLEEAEKRMQTVLVSAPGNVDALHTRASAEFGRGKLGEAEKTVNEILRRSPGHIKANIILALIRLAHNDQEGAEAVLKGALQNNPRSADAAVALGKFYLLTGRQQEAEAQFARAVAAEPDHAHAMLQLAALEMRAGRKVEAGEIYRKLATLPDRQFRTWHALFLAETGNPAGAIAELEQALKAAPSDRDVRSALIQVYTDNGRVADAEQLLSKALKENSKDVQALLHRTQLFLDRGDLAAAEHDVRIVLKYEPGSAAGHYLLSQVYRNRGELRTSTSELREALRFDPSMIAARLELAARLIDSNSAAVALELIEKAPERDRTSVAAALQRNWALIQLKRLPEAQKIVTEILRHGQLGEALLQQGVIQMEMGNSEGAKASLLAAVSQSPGDLRASKALTQVYLTQKKPAEAVAQIRSQIEKSPKSAALYQHLAQTLAATGDIGGAREALRAAKNIDPKSIDIELDLARTEIADNHFDSAKQILDGILRTQPNHAGARLMAGMLYDKTGNVQQAVAHYRKVLESDPRHPLALNNLAYHLSANDGAEQLDEALKYARLAREVSPHQAGALDDTIGWILYRKGLYGPAIRTLTNAVSEEPTAVRKFHLAMAHFKAGDRKEAVRAYNAALVLDARVPERVEAAKLLGIENR